MRAHRLERRIWGEVWLVEAGHCSRGGLGEVEDCLKSALIFMAGIGALGTH